jgi:hypothetical protein
MSNFDLLITLLAIVGLLLTVYFGMKALGVRKSQKQSVKGSSVGIQSGRDTKIGE